MATQAVLQDDALPAGRRTTWFDLFWLVILGIVLEGVYVGLYPLLVAGSGRANDVVQQALPGIFPWLPRVYWTTLWSPQLFARVPWLNSAGAGGEGNLLLLFFALALLFSLLAASFGRHALLANPVEPQQKARVFFWVMLSLTLLFGVTMFFAPIRLNMLSQDMLLYGLYGRIIVFYHANPYVVSPGAYSHDVLQGLVTSLQAQGLPVATSGPIWLDLTIPITLLAHGSIANLLLSFRLLGLLAHLANAVVLWKIVTKVRPEARLSATLLYAWNPLVLLLGIAQMHEVMIALLCVLLAILFLQREATLLSWVFALLAALLNLCCLLLLPLFLIMLLRQMRFSLWWRRVLWGAAMIVVTVLFVVLAYVPYWPSWGLAGLGTALRQLFWPDSAINSFDAALLNLPVHLPAFLSLLLAPQHWAIAMLIIEGVFLLFALWLAATVELTLLCGSWLFLLLVLLHPLYWPWFLLLPLALALGSRQRHAIVLVVLLMFGALLCCYFQQWDPTWPGQGLLVIGVPVLVWGWLMFFIAAWHRTVGVQLQKAQQVANRSPRLTRPPWLSRP